MNKLRIPENYSGVSKTLRLPENIVNDIQNLANLKNLSFNKVVISLLEFSLNNLDNFFTLFFQSFKIEGKFLIIFSLSNGLNREYLSIIDSWQREKGDKKSNVFCSVYIPKNGFKITGGDGVDIPYTLEL